MEKKNEFLQRQMQTSVNELKERDHELERLRAHLKNLVNENAQLKSKMVNFKDALSRKDTISLINECKIKSQQREMAREDEQTDLQRLYDEKSYEVQMKAKIFDVSRRAAEKFRQMSNER